MPSRKEGKPRQAKTIPKRRILSLTQAGPSKESQAKAAKRALLLASIKKNQLKRDVKGKPKGNRYRRTKRLRPCVLPFIFFVSLLILLLERYLGALFHLEDFKDAYYDQLGIDPWQAYTPYSKSIGVVPSIQNLTDSSILKSCRPQTRKKENVHNPNYYSLSPRKIPMIVHQTSKSRCLSRNYERAALQWSFQGSWSYYFHDDDAVYKLIHSDFPEFPHLEDVVDDCITSHSAKLDLWKYIALWVWGGIYADLNFYPSNFNSTTLQTKDDGFFLINPETQTLSTKVMAVSPRHPLMFYAIEHAINNILRIRNDRFIDPHKVIGEDNLNRALLDFQKAPNEGGKKGVSSGEISKGIIQGFQGRSVRVAGTIDGPEEYVTPVFIKDVGKKTEFSKMGIDLKNDFFSVGNCFQQMLHDTPPV